MVHKLYLVIALQNVKMFSMIGKCVILVQLRYQKNVIGLISPLYFKVIYFETHFQKSMIYSKNELFSTCIET